jgi:hypothetical protein
MPDDDDDGDDDARPCLFAVMKQHSVCSGHANEGVFSAVSAVECDGEVSCCQVGMRLLVVVAVAVMPADTGVGGDGGDEAMLNVPGSSLTLSAELSSYQVLLVK